MTTMKGSVLRSAPLALLRGVLFAAVLSAALILLFALFVLLFDLEIGIVTAVNQIIKVLSILFGTLVARKGQRPARVRGGPCRGRGVHGAGDRALLRLFRGAAPRCGHGRGPRARPCGGVFVRPAGRKPAEIGAHTKNLPGIPPALLAMAAGFMYNN